MYRKIDARAGDSVEAPPGFIAFPGGNVRDRDQGSKSSSPEGSPAPPARVSVGPRTEGGGPTRCCGFETRGRGGRLVPCAAPAPWRTPVAKQVSARG